MEISQIRNEIDQIDKQLVALFAQRMELSAQVAQYKSEHNLPILVPAREAHHGGYAAVLGLEDPDSLNFEDVIVAQDFRRRGIHSAFLHRAREMGYKTIYATVDPDNLPSLLAFEKAGYTRVAQRITYDGRPRVFVKLEV